MSREDDERAAADAVARVEAAREKLAELHGYANPPPCEREGFGADWDWMTRRKLKKAEARDRGRSGGDAA